MSLDDIINRLSAPVTPTEAQVSSPSSADGVWQVHVTIHCVSVGSSEAITQQMTVFITGFPKCVHLVRRDGTVVSACYITHPSETPLPLISDTTDNDYSDWDDDE